MAKKIGCRRPSAPKKRSRVGSGSDVVKLPPKEEAKKTIRGTTQMRLGGE